MAAYCSRTMISTLKTITETIFSIKEKLHHTEIVRKIFMETKQSLQAVAGECVFATLALSSLHQMTNRIEIVSRKSGKVSDKPGFLTKRKSTAARKFTMNPSEEIRPCDAAHTLIKASVFPQGGASY